MFGAKARPCEPHGPGRAFAPCEVSLPAHGAPCGCGKLVGIMISIPYLICSILSFVPAIVCHEACHGFAAYKLGDPTAKRAGRLSFNPLKHIDIVGFLMLYLVGFGWAKPVPVNPRNFKGDYRKCDLKVSLAGITMNLILFLGGAIVLYGVMGIALAGLPQVSEAALNVLGTDERAFITVYDGVRSVFIDGGNGYYTYWHVQDLLSYAPYAGEFIQLLWGDVPYYLFEMLSYFVQINIVLAIFNLIPIPPLDGYHVLNDLVLKRELYATQRATQIGYVVMIALLNLYPHPTREQIRKEMEG